MATKTTENTAAAQTGTVSIMLPLDERNDRPLFVGLNGVGYKIQRGVRVEVPEGVANIIRDAEVQQAAAFLYSEAMKYKGID